MAIRILDIVNYSNSKRPDADSGINLQKDMIKYSLQKYKELIYYIIAPNDVCICFEEFTKSKNVKIIPYNGTARQVGGVFNINLQDLQDSISLRKIDFDVIFNNVPESSHHFLYYLNKVHFYDIHTLNYIHWIDLQKDGHLKNRWNIPSILHIITGIISSGTTGCNSQFGKEKIIKLAEEWFNDKTLELIDEKLIPMTPGVNVDELNCYKKVGKAKLKKIVFPYRTQHYTGFRSTIAHLSKVWHLRKDFEVVFTNPSNYDIKSKLLENHPFIKVKSLDRREYIELLWESDIVLGNHNGTNQWSIAAVESVCAECIPLFRKYSFFEELLLNPFAIDKHIELKESFFFYRNSFQKKLSAILDNIELYKEKMIPLSKTFREYYDWRNRIHNWIGQIKYVDTLSSTITKNSNKFKEMENLILQNSIIRKEELLKHFQWHPKSRHISWTKYRKGLRQKFNETINVDEVIFRK